MKIDSLEVTVLQDGEVKLPLELLQGLNSADIQTLLSNGEPITTSVNAFLVRTGAHLLLVDAGGRGDLYKGDLGHLLERLHEAGVSPESIEGWLVVDAWTQSVVKGS